MEQKAENCRQRDLIRSRWLLLMLVMTAGTIAGQMLWPAANVWFSVGLLLSWAAFCGINARRCTRTHCYLTAPILLLGAVGILLLHFGVVHFPGYWINILIFGGIAVGCISEMVLGRYVRKT